MKKFLATTAIALVGMSTAASAQSVLERVLSEIDNSTNLASVNGTFANIAENIGGAATQTVYSSADGTITQEAYDALLNDIADTYAAELAAAGTAPSRADYTSGTAGQNAYSSDLATYNAAVTTAGTNRDNAIGLLEATYTADVIAISGANGVDGSITNIIAGLDAATQVAVASANTSATEWNTPTVDLGDMATTALGAVNTGDITLGVNSAVDDAKTTSTEAVSSVMTQLGGSADTGAIVLNIASNMTGVNGSISNTMNAVNGSVGALSTTALGAVNTGTITSGVNAAVQGIVGTSGQ